uniref:Arsenite methyltransferase n=1 Tax=Octactis speculum TaxID=3111310 RepID=A0A7S2AKV6_9STRA|mmetsp:Transcript_11630/g.15364  ORF Transcript_11630/g.15364 Transcript_11630/m.15364 type:complete len:317 (+) Transcript_11630:24-974(+)
MGFITVEDEDSFTEKLAQTDNQDVVVVLFHADWSKSTTFGPNDLERVAEDEHKPACLLIDLGDQDGQDLAVDLGMEGSLPQVWLYRGGSTANKSETVLLLGEKDDQAVSIVNNAIEGLRRRLKDGPPTDVHALVRAAYAETAIGGASVLPGDAGDPSKRSQLLGYDAKDVTTAADLGLGCGNPLATANLVEGEVVLDLGSGAGMDCFIAAKEVGPTGHVIGVDMTPEMLSKARETGKEGGFLNVTFRLGEIEYLPIGDASIDCVVSNCVINLSPTKAQVYREMNRVLVPGGRVSISDVLRIEDIPAHLQTAQAFAC